TVNDGARRCSCISRIWVVIKDTRFRIPLFIRVIDKACATNKFFRPDVFLTCSHYPAVPRRTILVQVAKYTVPYPLCVLLKYTFRLPALAIFLTIIFQAHRGITDFHPDSCPVSLIRSRSPISLIFTRVVIWVIVRFCAINGITSNTEPHVFVQTLDSDGNTIGIKRGCPLNQTLSRQDAVTQTALTRMPGFFEPCFCGRILHPITTRQNLSEGVDCLRHSPVKEVTAPFASAGAGSIGSCAGRIEMVIRVIYTVVIVLVTFIRIEIALKSAIRCVFTQVCKTLNRRILDRGC